MSKNSSESHKLNTKCLSVFLNILTGLQHKELVFNVINVVGFEVGARVNNGGS